MKNNGNMTTLLKGILMENPVLVLILGTCPTLAPPPLWPALSAWVSPPW